MLYSLYKLAKILQTSCFTKFGSSACQGSLSWHVQLPNPPTQISKLETSLQSGSYKYSLKKYFSTGSISSALLNVALTEGLIVILQMAFYLLLGCSKAKFGQTHQMLITVFFRFWPKGHWEPCNKVGSLSLAMQLVGFEPRTFRLYHNGLTRRPLSPYQHSFKWLCGQITNNTC